MNIYQNFSEEELLLAYNELLDNSGKINGDMQEILTESGYDEEFFAKANHKKVIVKEKGRIAFEVNKMVEKGHFFEEIEPTISSEILSDDELFNFILEKYIIFKSNHENEKIDKKTLYKSFLGVFVGTFA